MGFFTLKLIVWKLNKRNRTSTNIQFLQQFILRGGEIKSKNTFCSCTNMCLFTFCSPDMIHSLHLNAFTHMYQRYDTPIHGAYKPCFTADNNRNERARRPILF